MPTAGIVQATIASRAQSARLRVLIRGKAATSLDLSFGGISSVIDLSRLSITDGSLDISANYFYFVKEMSERTPPRPKLGEFEAQVLAALLWLEDEAYGVAIRQQIERRTGRAPSIGAVYTTLNRLEKKGLVKSRLGEPTAERGGRAKKYFEALPQGRAALAEMIRTLETMTQDLVLS